MTFNFNLLAKRRGWPYSVGRLIALLAGALGGGYASAEPAASLETTVGMEGVYYLRHRGPALEARPTQEQAPLVLRVADVARDGEWSIYELRYIASRPGTYDLREALTRVDGHPLPSTGPLTVSVSSLLGDDDRSDLVELTPPIRSRPWAYRKLAWLAGAAWLAPIAWLVGRRLGRREASGRRHAPVAAVGDPLPLLAAAALDGRITTQEQAQLEWLLLADWRERLALSDTLPADALRQLREHPDAAAFVAQLEAWLHRPGGQIHAELCQRLMAYLEGVGSPAPSTPSSEVPA